MKKTLFLLMLFALQGICQHASAQNEELRYNESEEYWELEFTIPKVRIIHPALKACLDSINFGNRQKEFPYLHMSQHAGRLVIERTDMLFSSKGYFFHQGYLMMIEEIYDRYFAVIPSSQTKHFYERSYGISPESGNKLWELTPLDDGFMVREGISE